MQDALLATGFPFREGDNYDAYIKSMKVMMEKTCGLRRIGSAALDLCWTACGRFDGYWEKGIKIWDIAAGALIAVKPAPSLPTSPAKVIIFRKVKSLPPLRRSSRK